MARFGRVLTAMITPFDEDGALDLDAARTLARWLQDNGNDGLVVAGTTGEAPALSEDETLSLFAAVVEAVSIPVIAGTGSNNTAHAVHLTKEATALGVSGILAVCPYYNRPSQAGIEAQKVERITQLLAANSGEQRRALEKKRDAGVVRSIKHLSQKHLSHSGLLTAVTRDANGPDAND